MHRLRDSTPRCIEYSPPLNRDSTYKIHPGSPLRAAPAPCHLIMVVSTTGSVSSRKERVQPFKFRIYLPSVHGGTQPNCSKCAHCGDEAKQLQGRTDARYSRSEGLLCRQAAQHIQQ